MLVSCTIDLSKEVKSQIEKESSTVFDSHPEYLWYDASEYALTLYSWPTVEPDLVDKLSDKLSELLFEQERFALFGFKYVVKIGSRIDVQLEFQEDRRYRALVDSITNFFSPEVKANHVPSIPLARYKIPSKQQYSHLKNQLAKIKSEVELTVDGVSLTKVTDFGNGIRKYEHLRKIQFAHDEMA